MNAFSAIVFTILAGEAFLFALVCALARVRRRERRADFILVPGARVWADGTVSRALLYRLQKALECYHKGLAGKIITAGGRGADEPAPEGEVMKRWLCENGVPADRIFSEESSRNTIENLKNARALLKKGETVLIVTSDYHLSRTLFLARRLSIKAFGVPAASVRRFPKWLEGRIRETVSWQILLAKLILGKIE